MNQLPNIKYKAAAECFGLELPLNRQSFDVRKSRQTNNPEVAVVFLIFESFPGHPGATENNDEIEREEISMTEILNGCVTW